jgi:hypothetical protein
MRLLSESADPKSRARGPATIRASCHCAARGARTRAKAGLACPP